MENIEYRGDRHLYWTGLWGAAAIALPYLVSRRVFREPLTVSHYTFAGYVRPLSGSVLFSALGLYMLVEEGKLRKRAVDELGGEIEKLGASLRQMEGEKRARKGEVVNQLDGVAQGLREALERARAEGQDDPEGLVGLLEVTNAVLQDRLDSTLKELEDLTVALAEGEQEVQEYRDLLQAEAPDKLQVAEDLVGVLQELRQLNGKYPATPHPNKGTLRPLSGYPTTPPDGSDRELDSPPPLELSDDMS